jgi:RNA polymerase sigma-70 factor (ECF subfamily)
MGRFEQIYEAHRASVSAFVRRRAPEFVVEDVVSETFLVCWRKLDRVPDEPLPWLYAVARRTLANQRRNCARARRE